jgi:hypothetical protein
VNQPGARRLVPPRPNLGPEPWSEAQPLAGFFVVAGTLACLLLVWLVWRRGRRGRVGRLARDLISQRPRDVTPRGRLVGLSDSIRDVLANQFGTSWRAKTTEELSAEVRLEDVLGREHLEELIRFLDQVDHLKFAPERSSHHHEALERELTIWEPRLADLKNKIQAKREGRVTIFNYSRRDVLLVEPHAQNVGSVRADP